MFNVAWSFWNHCSGDIIAQFMLSGASGLKHTSWKEIVQEGDDTNGCNFYIYFFSEIMLII